jgi:hypothetical protein
MDFDVSQVPGNRLTDLDISQHLGRAPNRKHHEQDILIGFLSRLLELCGLSLLCGFSLT